MKTILYLSFCLFLLLSCTQKQQIDNCYIYTKQIDSLPLEEIEYKLSLYDNQYNLSITVGTDELWHEQVISSGTFSKKRERVILKDSENENEMIFQIKGDSLMAKKTIFGLSSKSMHPSFGHHPHSTLIIKYDYDTSSFLLFEHYGNPYELYLSLNNDHSYRYTYHEHVITEGEWRREGNHLKLFDRNLEKPFICSIKRDRIILFEDEIGVTNEVKNINHNVPLN